METIRQGSKGIWVERWQTFLRGQGLLLEAVDGVFGPATTKATVEYQRRHGGHADGIVGNRTWGLAMSQGLAVIDDPDESKEGPNWPPKPKGLKPASAGVRASLFGEFEYTPAPTPSNPEGITILGSWVKDNIVSVDVPQLVGVTGVAHANSKGSVLFNRRAVPQLLALFQAWDDAGLMPLVKTWSGSWVPRYVRGSRTTLSNHSVGSAFDINAAWNGLGVQPALVGHPGSVRELVPLAAEHGFFWLGWSDTRPDGMHFEVTRLIP